MFGSEYFEKSDENACRKSLKKKLSKLIYGWEDVYSKPPSSFNFLADNILHLHYLLEVMKLRPKKVLEVGCGTASHSIFLSVFLRKTEFYCLDSNEKVLDVAKKNSQRYKRKNIKFIFGDAFHLSDIFKEKEFDIAISQGLLEHFSNEEIQKLINEQLSVAHVVIINVPSEYYPSEGVLGERRISKKEWWRNILREYMDKGYNVRIENLIDIGIRTRVLALKRGLKYFLKPMHYLIVIKDEAGD
ncbi:class I SAM-dependent methyltransferase [Archaeoglobus neptunius]|uniref:class I SAM-dependent methyltransferase n=1 Tax=Archaeoglobus neptunius TaxID=2798580 RepID=UPI001925DA43|nr:class I SAM-dependent methyltransferase [Archaeoglobus neptunius]